MLSKIRATCSKVNSFAARFLETKQKTAGPTVLPPQNIFKSNNLETCIKHPFGYRRPAWQVTHHYLARSHKIKTQVQTRKFSLCQRCFCASAKLVGSEVHWIWCLVASASLVAVPARSVVTILPHAYCCLLCQSCLYFSMTWINLDPWLDIFSPKVLPLGVVLFWTPFRCAMEQLHFPQRDTVNCSSVASSFFIQKQCSQREFWTASWKRIKRPQK